MINILRNVEHLYLEIDRSETSLVKQPKPENINSELELTTPSKAPKKNSVDIEALFQNRITRQLQTATM